MFSALCHREYYHNCRAVLKIIYNNDITSDLGGNQYSKTEENPNVSSDNPPIFLHPSYPSSLLNSILHLPRCKSQCLPDVCLSYEIPNTLFNIMKKNNGTVLNHGTMNKKNIRFSSNQRQWLQTLSQSVLISMYFHISYHTFQFM